MNLVGVTQAIRARALADTGSGGLFNVASPLVKSLYLNFGPAADTSLPLSNVMPYIVLSVSGEKRMDGFNFDLYEINAEFHIWDMVENGSTTGGAIIDRIYGDALAQSGRIPTYGFHRHGLTLTTNGLGWHSGTMTKVGSATAHELDVYHWIETYSVGVTLIGV